MRKPDRIAALILLGVCAAAWLAARSFSPLSALFPRVIIAILAALSLLLLITSFVGARPEASRERSRADLRAVGLTVGLMIAWVVLITPLGFLTTSLLCFALMVVLPDRGRQPAGRQVKLVAIVWVLTVVFYLFFDRLLLVSFPRGLLI